MIILLQSWVLLLRTINLNLRLLMYMCLLNIKIAGAGLVRVQLLNRAENSLLLQHRVGATVCSWWSVENGGVMFRMGSENTGVWIRRPVILFGVWVNYIIWQVINVLVIHRRMQCSPTIMYHALFSCVHKQGHYKYSFIRICILKLKKLLHI